MAQSLSREVVLSTEHLLKARDEVSLNGCPRFKVSDGFLPLNGEIASGYLRCDHRLVPHIQDRLGSYYLRLTKPGENSYDRRSTGVEK